MRYLFDNPKQTRTGLVWVPITNPEGSFKEARIGSDHVRDNDSPSRMYVKIRDTEDRWRSHKNFVFEATLEISWNYSDGLRVIDVEEKHQLRIGTSYVTEFVRAIANGQVTSLGDNKVVGRFTWDFTGGKLGIKVFEDPHAVPV